MTIRSLNTHRRKRWLLGTASAFMLLFVLSGCGQSVDRSNNTGHAQEHAHGHSETGHTADKLQEQASVRWLWPDGDPEAGSSQTLQIQILNAQSKLMDDLQIGHEKKLHLIVVSKDLQVFQHLHPQEKEPGSFELDMTFPAAGEYKLIADFIPAGSGQTTRSEWVTVSGNQQASKTVQPEKELRKTVDGMTIELELDKLKAGEETQLRFRFADAASGAEIRDLQPYLGATGHVVIMDAAAEQYLHVHPVQELGQGPEASFATVFPEAGVYRIWGQFQRGGEVVTVPFTVEIK